MEFSASASSVVDTVVVRYFVMADEVDLLLSLLGAPLGTPRIVFDPDEPDEIDDDARSEIGRSIQYQWKASGDPARNAAEREQAVQNAERLSAVAQLHEVGDLDVLDLSSPELEVLGALTSPAHCKDFGLRFPLHPGEAACVAIAVERRMTLVTDDADALRALASYRRDHPYERIRKLLIRAADQDLCSKQHANDIHREMRRLGFWDHDEPFPDQRSGA